MKPAFSLMQVQLHASFKGHQKISALQLCLTYLEGNYCTVVPDRHAEFVPLASGKDVQKISSFK